MPGETFEPVIATRIGCRTFAAETPSASISSRRPFLDGRGVERLGGGDRVGGLAEQRARTRLHHLPPDLRIDVARSGLGEQERDQRPDLGHRLRLVADDLAGLAARLGRRGGEGRGGRRIVALEVGGELGLVAVERLLAHVAPVQPAQLPLVEDRRRPADPVDREALDELVGARGSSRRPRRPSRAAPGSCGRPPAGSRPRAAPGPRRRRGASRASCRRGRAAAAGGRSAARASPRASSTSSCRGVFERWSSPRITSVIPMSASSTATAKL